MARSVSSDLSANKWGDLSDARLRDILINLSNLADKDPRQAERLQSQLSGIRAELEVRRQTHQTGGNLVSKEWLARVSPRPPTHPLIHPRVPYHHFWAVHAETRAWPCIRRAVCGRQRRLREQMAATAASPPTTPPRMLCLRYAAWVLHQCSAPTIRPLSMLQWSYHLICGPSCTWNRQFLCK